MLKTRRVVRRSVTMSPGVILALIGITTALLTGGETTLAKEKHGKLVTMANLNIFHGIDCAALGDKTQCRLKDRINLLFEHLKAIGCPDLVTLQEIVTSEFVQSTPTVEVGPLNDAVTLITERLPRLAAVCGFIYRVVFDPDARRPPALGRGIDEELILTRYPARSSESLRLYSPLDPLFFRHVLYARIDHPVGLLDVFTTHLAADSDLANLPCGSPAPLPPPLRSPTCPAECVGDSVRQCQARQVAAFVEKRHRGFAPAMVSGDFNAEPTAREYATFQSHGWLDSHLVAGNAECNSRNSFNCTSGRDALSGELDKPTPNVRERIDYIFVVPSERCDIQAQGTGLFADEPNPFLPKHRQCGPFPKPVCWASDHNGNRLTLSCEQAAHRDRHRSPW